MRPIFAASHRRRSSNHGPVSGFGGVVRANEGLYRVASLALASTAPYPVGT